MIKYNLTCKCGEMFESWFINSSEFDSLRKKKTYKVYLLRIIFSKKIGDVS